jgi:hypothetical protein
LSVGKLCDDAPGIVGLCGGSRVIVAATCMNVAAGWRARGEAVQPSMRVWICSEQPEE